jgi:hypothetical protein
MQAVCAHCGEAMIAGRVAAERLHGMDGRLFINVSAGTPGSLNPAKGALPEARAEPAFREQSCPIRGRVCPRCGRLEFFLDVADLAKVSAFAAPQAPAGTSENVRLPPERP